MPTHAVIRSPCVSTASARPLRLMCTCSKTPDISICSYNQSLRKSAYKGIEVNDMDSKSGTIREEIGGLLERPMAKCLGTCRAQRRPLHTGLIVVLQDVIDYSSGITAIIDMLFMCY
jgi:hypothetical protein